jgi:caffeoyl-CoA O-methyltransferase
MFHAIPTAMLDRMRVLEAIDARDRGDGTPRMQRLRQIPAESGKLLALLAAGAPLEGQGDVIEIGTSAGYSAMWISLAMLGGRRLTTYEVLPDKIALAQETFRLAQLESRIDLVQGDARDHLARHESIAFCFLDAEKTVYRDCYDLVVPRLAPGGFLVADNVISHAADLQPLVEHALGDPRVDALVVPVGKGLLVARRT